MSSAQPMVTANELKDRLTALEQRLEKLRGHL
jgi:hypothetical protein